MKRTDDPVALPAPSTYPTAHARAVRVIAYVADHLTADRPAEPFNNVARLALINSAAYRRHDAASFDEIAAITREALALAPELPEHEITRGEYALRLRRAAA